MNRSSTTLTQDASSKPSAGFAETLRQRFERLRRQTELTPDVTCFRPDGKLASVRFIAHPHGLHVAIWLKVLSHTQAKVAIESPAPVPTFSNDFVATRSIVPRFLKLPMLLRYFLCGLFLRFFGQRDFYGVTHAHSASGNGLTAWLSGQPYLIGVYGSEIYGADQRGFVYRWLLKRILQDAERIHTSSPSSQSILTEKFKIPKEKIYSFQLGYDESCFHWLDEPQRKLQRKAAGLPTDQPIWVVSRRTNPHYRTQEVVSGFLDYCDQGGCGHLVLICGDLDPNYTRVIRNAIEAHPHGRRITMIEQILQPNEFAAWLQIADFSISVPKTDNFSSSIWESMACGAVPILANLNSYDEARQCRSIRWMNRYEPVDFTQMFHETSKAITGTFDASRDECYQFARSWFSTEKAVRALAAFYLGEPLPKQEFQQVDSAFKPAAPERRAA